jgi:hypothetical protein
MEKWREQWSQQPQPLRFMLWALWWYITAVAALPRKWYALRVRVAKWIDPKPKPRPMGEFLFPAIRAPFPTNPINELVSVQPMPVGAHRRAFDYLFRTKHVIHVMTPWWGLTWGTPKFDKHEWVPMDTADKDAA